MNKKVLITLNISQDIDDEAQNIEFFTVGNYYEKTNKKYITYEESQMTGFEGFTTTLRLEEDKVTMTRFGTPNTQLIFEEGQKHLGFYNTPYGGLMVGVRSNSVVVESLPDGIDIMLDYDMEFDNTVPTHNNLSIKVREA